MTSIEPTNKQNRNTILNILTNRPSTNELRVMLICGLSAKPSEYSLPC